jgi:formamidopyrimidine-DNA glycosylase
MPELPEVESVRRLLARLLEGRTIVQAQAYPDEIVFKGLPADAIESALQGRRVVAAGRKGKFFWLELDRKPWLCAHLGMSGWVREIGGRESRIREHGQAPLYDEAGNPRFAKLILTSDRGDRAAFTDGRRLGRIWLCDDPLAEKSVAQLGPDAWSGTPDENAFHELYARRKAPIKALLLNQAILSGIGNWIADEMLYHARIAPHRAASTLTQAESKRLRRALLDILKTAIEVEADSDRFPEDWLFHRRWGGKRGQDRIGGKAIVRETIGGRTTAWIPEVQK